MISVHPHLADGRQSLFSAAATGSGGAERRRFAVDF
jgi:hypothetical protein